MCFFPKNFELRQPQFDFDFDFCYFFDILALFFRLIFFKIRVAAAASGPEREKMAKLATLVSQVGDTSVASVSSVASDTGDTGDTVGRDHFRPLKLISFGAR